MIKPKGVLRVLGGCAALACVWCLLGADCFNLFPPVIPPPTGMIATSLHNTRVGKDTFYSGKDGFFDITGVGFSCLDCNKCHSSSGERADGTTIDAAAYVPSCADCHATPSSPTGQIEEAICLGCHSRQGAERGLYDDVHRAAGKVCMDCHGVAEVHGDGIAYASHLASPSPACTDCHNATTRSPGPITENDAHKLHAEGVGVLSVVDCSACHMQSVIACYDCHFESTLQGGGKRFFPAPNGEGKPAAMKDFLFLVNRGGKVCGATFQALVGKDKDTGEDKSFVVVAPFYSHTITRAGRACTACHYYASSDAGNANVREYANNGQITIAAWDGTQAGANRITGPSGVIPVPTDWADAFQFDHLDYLGDPSSTTTDATQWVFLKNTTDQTQMLEEYSTPLTAAQMADLGG